MAECHPVGFRWVMKAKERSATIIHVDPRFTRTSAVADIHVPIRAGSDIAFLGGIIHYILENKRWFHDYVVNYTNAAAILTDEFRDTEDNDGLFSGWNSEKGEYDREKWMYAGVEVESAAGKRAGSQPPTPIQAEHTDPTLQHPRCVFQVLMRHYQRYTPEMVERTCGVPPRLFTRVAEALCRNSGRERTGAFCYAVGWTQHTTGVQCIRAASIIQLLLGNMGRPGGGIMALRGHASIQGSTDIPTLYNLLPGYLPLPRATHGDLAKYNQANTSPSGWWGEFPKYSISLLKAWYGDAAKPENDWCFHHLPAITGDHSHMNTVADMADGKLKGYFVMGENPVVGTVNGALHRKGLRALEWLVVRDFQLTETADFWRIAPEIERGDVRPEEIGTEVFFFPAAAHTEKNGSFTNTQRLLQWHYKAIEPPGECRSELDFIFRLGRRMKELYADSEEPRDRAIRDVTWDYPLQNNEPDAEAVLREIHGYRVADGKLVDGFTDLKDDGSTACGCWIYSGCYKDGINQAARRKPHWEQSWVAPEWAWSWPHNRRLLYNRASADPDGRPWSERKSYVWWDETQQKWTGHDEPDFVKKPPSYRPGPDARGKETIGGADPFVMQADGKGWLYVPSGLQDGPLPTHYEHQESPIKNPLYGQQCNPARMEWMRNQDNPYHQPFDDPRFPYLLTTYRLTEHHTAGGMSRWLTWLSELQPEAFCEVSPELAAEVGLENRGWATIRSARGEIESRVLVTRRMTPLHLNGHTVHQIGMPYHWSSKGLVRGDCPNELFPFVADPNVSIMETKGITVAIEPGRRGRWRRRATSGPLTPDLPGKEFLRDTPPARHRPETGHGHKTDHTKEGH